MIRKATLDDVPWLMTLALESYGTKVKSVEASEKWLRWVIAQPQFIVLRSDKSAIIALCEHVFYEPEVPVVRTLFIATTSKFPRELGDMLLNVAAWATPRGARRVQFDGGMIADLGPIARDIGAKQTQPRYYLEIQ